MQNANTYSIVAYVKIYANDCKVVVKHVGSGPQTLPHP